MRVDEMACTLTLGHECAVTTIRETDARLRVLCPWCEGWSDLVVIDERLSCCGCRAYVTVPEEVV